ncbi:TetR/AcrR family transcriptional regulator [Nocardia sp. 2]|uniref:TetR/AcrR family transcriptional regulator n=1 Tax=Nocardia acididurans TaxID=2802282 RepID=A0ABS1MBI4_9NOCA|nr:TetR/AcrR family transcriptional regulator [Nocardia acididurans]MBL1078003.1 TetR/AcrR family transcriptional regulator [Nocardia acididurans]
MSPRKAAALRDSADDRGLRDHLLSTAQRLIAEQGAAGLTVRAIARAAGVADGVLYNHFTSKEDLLLAAVRAHVDTAHRELGPLPTAGDATVAENLHTYLRAGLALHQAILPVFAGLLATPAILARYTETPGDEQAWRTRLTTYLAAERALARLAPATDIDAAAALLAGICHDRVLTALLPTTPPPTADIDAVITVLLAGIAPHGSGDE